MGSEDMMMAEDKDKNVGQEEVDVITLEFEEGEPVDCEIMGVFDVDGKDYIALIPDDDSDDVWIYGYKEVDDEGSFELEDIEDEELFEKVANEFDSIMEDASEE